MRYAFDMKLTGYEQVTVNADNLEEAQEQALDRFWEIHYACNGLRQKVVHTELIGKTEEFDKVDRAVEKCVKDMSLEQLRDFVSEQKHEIVRCMEDEEVAEFVATYGE